MSRSNVAMPTLLLLLFTMPLDAAVIERDWQTPGDGLLTFDTVNQREWLDLSETLLVDFGNNPTYVLAQLTQGGQFEGFHPATLQDVIGLGQSAGIDTTTLDFARNEDPTENLIDLLSETFESGKRSLGLVEEFVNQSLAFPDQLVVNIFTGMGPASAGISTFVFTPQFSDRATHIVGVFLYRQVPEPSGVVLLFCSLSVLGSARRFKF